MKLKHAFLTILLLLPFFCFAQDDHKQMEADRVGIYSRILQLTPDEAKKFWPVFNEFQEQMEKLQKQLMDTRRNTIGNSDKLTDAEVEKAIDEILTLEQQQLDLKKKYAKEFKKVLPVKKVILIQRAEREYKKVLLHRFREKHPGDDN